MAAPSSGESMASIKFWQDMIGEFDLVSCVLQQDDCSVISGPFLP